MVERKALLATSRLTGQGQPPSPLWEHLALIENASSHHHIRFWKKKKRTLQLSHPSSAISTCIKDDNVTMSTRVALYGSPSSQRQRSLICSLSFLPVMSGKTSGTVALSFSLELSEMIHGRGSRTNNLNVTKGCENNTQRDDARRPKKGNTLHKNNHRPH